jgi:TRAP-type uncharacterized transport system fused permease subunit
VLLQVHFRALKRDIKGIPKEKLPSKRKAFIDSFPYLMSVATIVVLLALVYTPFKAGVYSVVFIIVINLAIAAIRHILPLSFKQVIESLDIGARMQYKLL